ncbi:MAG: hypothetical protein JXL81_13950 [Deltaproteobacteria bacterium]|nr:hypothetical protein [Deltaproteobacteria bacterium]
MKKNTVKIISLNLILVISTCFSGCKNWEYNIEKNGIHFTKICESENRTIIGYMKENLYIQGFPCEKGWIHFKKDWQLQSFQLSKGFTYNNTPLPAHTWILFPYHESQTGYVLALPFDYEIQGYLCGGSGGYKGTHTGFYDNGRLRSFFPPEDVAVDGIPCEASLLYNVNLYENGHIKSCKLAEDYKIDGVTYNKGKIIGFDKDGKVN